MFVDICVHAKTEREHDENNYAESNGKVKGKNLTLNKNK